MNTIPLVIDRATANSPSAMHPAVAQPPGAGAARVSLAAAQAPASTAPDRPLSMVEPVATAPSAATEPEPETEIFSVSPVARAFPGQLLTGWLLIGLAAALAMRIPDFERPDWVPLIPLALGALMLLLLWVRLKSSRYRLTTQRLFVQRGWLARHVNELELYRVKDVVVSQGTVQRLLGYGTVTVVADDDTTPEVQLVNLTQPAALKEMIRTQYRAARQREGVHPTELIQTP